MLKPKGKRRASTARELEAIIEDLMVEVSVSLPQGAGLSYVKTWAHMTAMYVSEVVKRKDSPRETIIKKAQRAVRRRIERELSDSYLRMDLPKWEESIQAEPATTITEANSDRTDDGVE